MKKKTNRGWIIGLLTPLLVLLLAAGFFFGVNRFSIRMELTGEPVQTLESGVDTYTEEGAKAYFCGSLIFKQGFALDVRRAGSINLDRLGEQSVTYRADFLLWHGKAKRTVTVQDTLAPEITLKGDAEVTINAGTAYTDPGATAVDNNDGDLTDKMTVEGSVDIYRAGTYTITYTATDSFGNTATKERTVCVKALRQPDKVEPGSKTVYLTFDDGPSKYTSELLDVLKKYNVKATFFIVNTGYTDLISRELSEGHSVGIHSATHQYSTIYASEEAYFADLQKVQDAIVALSGKETTLVRFPGGSSNTVSSFNPGIMTRLTQALTDMGYQYFDWNVSSGDAGETTSTDQVFENVISGMQNHNVSIVLQHDIKGFSVAAVERIIVWGLANGYTFLPLDASSPTAHHRVNN